MTYDSANRVIYFESSVTQCKSMERAEEYIKGRHAEHKRLFGEVIEALITFQKTGIPCRPNWNNNKSDSRGFKNGKWNDVPKQNEVKVRRIIIKRPKPEGSE